MKKAVVYFGIFSMFNLALYVIASDEAAKVKEVTKNRSKTEMEKEEIRNREIIKEIWANAGIQEKDSSKQQ